MTHHLSGISLYYFQQPFTLFCRAAYLFIICQQILVVHFLFSVHISYHVEWYVLTSALEYPFWRSVCADVLGAIWHLCILNTRPFLGSHVVMYTFVALSWPACNAYRPLINLCRLVLQTLASCMDLCFEAFDVHLMVCVNVSFCLGILSVPDLIQFSWYLFVELSVYNLWHCVLYKIEGIDHFGFVIYGPCNICSTELGVHVI